MTADKDLLRQALRVPRSVRNLDLAGWDHLIRLGRAAGLLARLAENLEEAGLLDGVPEKPRLHLDAERILAKKHARDVRWEVACLRRALVPLGIPVCLLKGAAYLLSGLPAARGRMFSDVDILVPKEAVAETERVLLGHGYIGVKSDPYDDRYYRQWMHQIPPLHHFQRDTVVDVHHTIVPETARAEVDARSLREMAAPVAGLEDLWVLAPPDMVLHSAVHLFNEGEFDHGLRDVSDLDLLLRHFGTDDEFWLRLLDRARAWALMRPLYYALRHTERLLATPVPADVAAACADEGRPGPATAAIMETALERALRPDHRLCDDALTAPVRLMLYVRAHYLRMPLHLLLPHLARKALRKDEEG
jgi:hypothetical protein